MRGTQCLKKLCERTAQETSASEQRQVSSGERSEKDCDVKEEKKATNEQVSGQRN